MKKCASWYKAKPWVCYRIETHDILDTSGEISQKSLKRLEISVQVLEFTSSLNVVDWKEFFDAFSLSKTEYKS